MTPQTHPSEQLSAADKSESTSAHPAQQGHSCKHCEPPLRERVAAAVAGDQLPLSWLERWEQAAAVFSSKRPQFVKCACSSPVERGFMCLVHRQYLANVCQLDFHTEQGHHSIARLCELHGFEEV